MIAIGERINGMYEDVKKAIAEKDPGPVQDLARRQTEAGAKFLDINVGTAAADREAAMRWLVQVAQETVDTPLSIDSTNFDVVCAGVEAAKNPVLINSTKGEPALLEKFVPLAVEKNAQLVALTMDSRGVPADVNTRVEIAATVVTFALEKGLDPSRLFIDPIILPINVAQDQPQKILEAMQQIRMLSDPAPHIVVGLSNVSQSTKVRSLLNRTFLVMALAAGLDAAIVDVFDKELMDAAITAEIILNKSIYSDDYLRAARK
ncbi:MAG: hypothetical protein AMS15_05690 [Planctomycetes bacterium DG_23]|nr:MAG: hypothetical protein AMS15_05690 [Planctomycetes bacterium DG_23]